MKRDSTEFAILQSLNIDEIRHDPWNPAPNLLYTAEREDDAILGFERLFGCDDPPLQTVANVIDYIRQALEVMTQPFALALHLRLPPSSPQRAGHADEQHFRVCVFSTSTKSCIARMATRGA